MIALVVQLFDISRRLDDFKLVDDGTVRVSIGNPLEGAPSDGHQGVTVILCVPSGHIRRARGVGGKIRGVTLEIASVADDDVGRSLRVVVARGIHDLAISNGIEAFVSMNFENEKWMRKKNWKKEDEEDEEKRRRRIHTMT